MFRPSSLVRRPLACFALAAILLLSGCADDLARYEGGGNAWTCKISKKTEEVLEGIAVVGLGVGYVFFLLWYGRYAGGFEAPSSCP